MGGSTYTILGGAVGAVGGFFAGNPVLGAQVGASIGGGIDRMNQLNNNADAVIQASQFNSAHALQVAEFNAQFTQATSFANASISLLGASLSALTTEAVTAYNANVATVVSEYNASLFEQEAGLVYESLELDIDQFERVAAQAKGTATVFYGASGVVIDEPRDTPANTLLDMDIERDLEIAIMRHNADIQAGKLLTAAAQTRFQGQVQTQQILFEGLTAANLTRLQGGLSAIGTTTQGALDASIIRTQGTLDARAITANALIDANQFRKAGDQALFDGLFQGAKIIAANRLVKLAEPKPTPPRNRSQPLSLLGTDFEDEVFGNVLL